MPDSKIIEFVTDGPKNYAYKIARPGKDGNTTICKVRGITLNYKNSLTINFDTTKDIVIDNRDDVKTVRDDFKITRDHKRLLTVHQDKDCRIIFDKSHHAGLQHETVRICNGRHIETDHPSDRTKKPELRQLVPLYRTDL